MIELQGGSKEIVSWNPNSTTNQASLVVSRNKDWKITVRKSLARSHLRRKKEREGDNRDRNVGRRWRLMPENMERSIEFTILGRAEDANGGRSKRFFFVSITISTRCPILLRSSLILSANNPRSVDLVPLSPNSFAFFPPKIFPPLHRSGR